MDYNTTAADKKPMKFDIKIVIIIAAVIAVAVLGYIFKGLFIAATVDGNPISRLAVIQKLEKMSGKDLLDSLIVEKLIQNEAKAKKIIISNDEINAEIKKIEDRIVAQGDTFDSALLSQGMTKEDLKKQIILQKELEKLLADKISVTDEEAAQYIKDNAISILKGQEATIAAQIKDELRNQKLSAAANVLIATLKLQAKINYFVNY